MGKGCCFDVVSPSIKRLGSSPLGLFPLLCLLLAVDSSSSAIVFLVLLTNNLSNVSCFCLLCIIFLKCIIALSLEMCTALFDNMEYG